MLILFVFVSIINTGIIFLKTTYTYTEKKREAVSYIIQNAQ